MNKVRDAILGLAVGDALGVPVEFRTREELKRYPVTNMREYGTHDQPRGTWSDDSSLTFCLAESLSGTFSLADLATRFINWVRYAYWTPHGRVFDIGITTHDSIDKLARMLKNGESHLLRTLTRETNERTNGNGSLMRILPLYFYLKAQDGKSIEEQFRTIHEVSALTHGHIRSALACLIYLVLADEIVAEKDKMEAYRAMQKRMQVFFAGGNIDSGEMGRFRNIIEQDIFALEEDEIDSGGYVVVSLEASLWCFLNTDTYADAVLTAVNLGDDTDTTGAITGGLAGLYYGEKEIPAKWLDVLVLRQDIERLCDKLHEKYPL